MTKDAQRLKFRKVRGELSPGRRLVASKRALLWLRQQADCGGLVLSYASFGSELDTWWVNRFLMERGKLVLPKVVRGDLALFRVEKESQLAKGYCGIMEPVMSLCQSVDPRTLSLALVPGLVFDRACQRVGYGKGFYDRLLSQLSFQAEKVGLGFQEQLTSNPLVTMPHDVSMNKLALL